MSADNDPKVEGQDPLQDQLDEDRRKFLAACGKFAAVTPPALTMLLSTSLNSEAVAKSGGGRDGPPRGDRDRDLLEWLDKLLSKFF
ncbi:hypothetical protein ONR75_24930 [Rhodopseudomonas sp. P2A-2r]|nr:hypothetical protein [Rhodopseudomonas sp. P2A-2r]UZE48062.1 hypothetical protein ONR75_24930 [Rhodopseudomonas sp. P2A-2r]